MLSCSESASNLKSQQCERGSCTQNTHTRYRGICSYRHIATGRGCTLARDSRGNITRGCCDLRRLRRVKILTDLRGKTEQFCQGRTISNKLQDRVRNERGNSILFWSLELQELNKIQGPILVASSLDLEHKQGRSEAVQLIAVAAELRQGSAHVGNCSTRLEISVEVLVEAVAVVEMLALLLALCAKTWPMIRADKPKQVLKCILRSLVAGKFTI